MRLHRLQLSAFGPFEGEIDLDLDRLGADGLFLLYGDTGAGKTTVLDAIAFALFGRVPGARNEAKRLRCDRADPGTRTFVRLEATLGGHRVEIFRSPAYLRPKARGDGLTEEKHKVHLRWSGAGPAGARAEGITRADEVGLTVTDLLGMSADQFFQVVLLPQGDFARFLRSDTADREVLLERLFETGRFGTIEEWFSAARRDSAARVRDCRVRIGQLTARVAEAAGDSTCPDTGVAEWLADLRDRLADDAAVTAEAEGAARQSGAHADRALLELRVLAARIEKLCGLRRREAELDRGAGERARWRQELTAHAKAQPVVAAALRAAQLARRSREEQTIVERRRVSAEQLVAPEEDLPKTANDLRALSALTREQAGALVSVMAEVQVQERDRSALVAAVRSRDFIVENINQLDVLLAELPGQVEMLSAQVATGREAAGRVGALSERAAATHALVAAARSVPLRRIEHEKAVAVLASAIDEHQRAVDHRQHLTEQRILGMAAELAGNLGFGECCPVCGASDHPQLAAPASDAATPEQITRAEKAERLAAAVRERASHAAEREALLLAEATALTLGRSLDEATADWTAVSAELAAQSAVADGLTSAEASLSRVSDSLQQAAQQRLLLETSRRSAGSEVERLRTAVAERGEWLTQACAGYPDVAARRAHLLELATELDRLAAAVESLNTAEVAHSEATTSLVEAIAASPFTDLTESRAAVLSDPAEMSQRLRSAEDDITVMTAQLSDPELAGVDASLDIDVSAAQNAAVRARLTTDAASMQASAAALRRDRVATAAAKLAAAWRDLEPVLAADAELAALTDVILGKGQNSRSMSLRTFVLAAKLSQVALSASERLAAMSGGRYTFVQSEEKEARGRSGGLGLDILDAFSGRVRPAKTLSGGESFLASLSLALGLADVVAAESGGRQLDTIFIDEGFGSLDSDTLDLVMGTLDELRAGGRTVGLVSHVDELRQRIPSRLRISQTAVGSKLEFSVS